MYIKFNSTGNLSVVKEIQSGFLRVEEVTGKKLEQTFRGDSNAPYLELGDDNTGYSFVKTCQICTLKIHAL